MGDYDDLAKLPSIDPSVVMDTLKARHAKDGIYTKNGAVLVAINPYKPISLYSDNHLKQYKSSMSLESEPPHIFAVAAATHRAMVTESTNQAVVISGESGAGKTESARFVLQYLRFVTNATEDLEMRIHTSQPLTEAFGCAKTMRNDNRCRAPPRCAQPLQHLFCAAARCRVVALSRESRAPPARPACPSILPAPLVPPFRTPRPRTRARQLALW
jgi:myosin heavy subunit